jgi:hypothetical protein
VSSAPATAITSCLQPIDKEGLDGLIAKGKANPTAVRTLKCRTIAEGRFRHLNMIRTLPAHVIDEPPGLLGNAVARNITIRSLELELEADINITAVWGTGDTSPKPVGFDAVRVKVHLDADAPKAALDDLIAHATKWSPVANTFTKPVALDVAAA